MALIFPSSSTFITFSHKSRHQLRHLTAIKAQNTSSSPESSESSDETSSSLKSESPPLGFGSTSSVSTSSPVKKQKGKKERARIIRRDPVDTPKFASQQAERGGEASNEQGINERAFLLAWLGLGSLIIFEGLALAASGIANYNFELKLSTISYSYQLIEFYSPKHHLGVKNLDRVN